MVYTDKKKRWHLGSPPLNKNIKIQSPPKEVPVPEGVLGISWDDLDSNQCQWALDGFWDGPSNTFPCCGLPVNGNGLGRRFCDYHKKIAQVGVR